MKLPVSSILTLQSQDERDSPFEYGALELDLKYAYNKHYAVSTALVWKDDSAAVRAGVIDYHLFDDDFLYQCEAASLISRDSTCRWGGLIYLTALITSTSRQLIDQTCRRQ